MKYIYNNFTDRCCIKHSAILLIFYHKQYSDLTVLGDYHTPSFSHHCHWIFKGVQLCRPCTHFEILQKRELSMKRQNCFKTCQYVQRHINHDILFAPDQPTNQLYGSQNALSKVCLCGVTTASRSLITYLQPLPALSPHSLTMHCPAPVTHHH